MAWLGESRRVVLRCHRAGKPSLRRFKYWKPLRGLAVQLLAKRGLRVASLDKELGVVLVEASDLTRIQEAILPKPYYRKLDTDGARAVSGAEAVFLRGV